MFLREAKMNSGVCCLCLCVCAQRSERNAQSMYFVLPLSGVTWRLKISRARFLIASGNCESLYASIATSRTLNAAPRAVFC
jgi:hypothetical protein